MNVEKIGFVEYPVGSHALEQKFKAASDAAFFRAAAHIDFGNAVVEFGMPAMEIKSRKVPVTLYEALCNEEYIRDLVARVEIGTSMAMTDPRYEHAYSKARQALEDTGIKAQEAHASLNRFILASISKGKILQLTAQQIFRSIWVHDDPPDYRRRRKTPLAPAPDGGKTLELV